MKVSDEQRRILSAVLLQADKPNAEIARSLGVREHTVRRAVSFLFYRDLSWKKSLC